MPPGWRRGLATCGAGSPGLWNPIRVIPPNRSNPSGGFFKAAQLVENEGQQTLKPAVTAEWREVLKGCRERVRMWSARTAPQRRAQSGAPYLFTSRPSHRYPVPPSEKTSHIMPSMRFMVTSVLSQRCFRGGGDTPLIPSAVFGFKHTVFPGGRGSLGGPRANNRIQTHRINECKAWKRARIWSADPIVSQTSYSNRRPGVMGKRLSGAR